MLVICVLSTTIYAGENCRNPHAKKSPNLAAAPPRLMMSSPSPLSSVAAAASALPVQKSNVAVMRGVLSPLRFVQRIAKSLVASSASLLSALVKGQLTVAEKL